MATIKGKWVFNEVLDLSNFPSGFTSFFVVFTDADGVVYRKMRICNAVTAIGGVYYHYTTVNTDMVRSYYKKTRLWESEAYRTIDFGKAEQEVADDFCTWLTDNAIEIRTPAATIAYNGEEIATLQDGQTATLKCAGMQMVGDVVMEVAESPKAVLQNKTIIENGSFYPDDGCDGFNYVTVDVPIPEGYIQPSGTLSITENGTHDVSGYANAEVNVESSGGGGSISVKATAYVTEPVVATTHVEAPLLTINTTLEVS